MCVGVCGRMGPRRNNKCQNCTWGYLNNSYASFRPCAAVHAQPRIREFSAMRNRACTAYSLDVCIHYSKHTFGYLVFQSSVAVGSRHNSLVRICSTAVSYHGEANRAHETTSGRSNAATIAYAGARLGAARPRGALAAPIGGDCTV